MISILFLFYYDTDFMSFEKFKLDFTRDLNVHLFIL